MSRHCTSFRLQAQQTCCRRSTVVRKVMMSSRNADGNNAPSTPSGTVSRRHAEAGLLALTLSAFIAAPSAQAIGFKKELKKKKTPIEDYSELPNGLKYYDLESGKGAEVAPGSRVTAHFDCIFRGIDVVSTRSARLLGGNRTVAEPLEFIAGEPVQAAAHSRVVGESAGGLFAGSSGPRPPPALSTAVIGMKVGGKRSVIVPAELGYGDEGEQEIGPGQTFEMKIELLEIAVSK